MGRLGALVLAGNAGADARLVAVLAGEQAEAERQLALDRQRLQRAAHLRAEMVVMGRLAANDAADGDEAVEALRRIQRNRDRDRKLERAGDLVAVPAVAGLLDDRSGPGNHLVADVLVIGRDDHHDVGHRLSSFGIGRRPAMCRS